MPAELASANGTHTANERKRESGAENGATRGWSGKSRQRKALSRVEVESGLLRKSLEILAINAKARGRLASGFIVNSFGWAIRGRPVTSPNATLQATLALKGYRALRFQASATGGDKGVCDLSVSTPLPAVNSGPERKAVNDSSGLSRRSGQSRPFRDDLHMRPGVDQTSSYRVARSTVIAPLFSTGQSSMQLGFRFPRPLDRRPDSLPNGFYHFG